MNEVWPYLYRKVLMEGASIKMSGKNKFYMTIPQAVFYNDSYTSFNMIIELKIFRGKLKMILKDVKENK